MYQHGGDIYSHSIRLDFSTNINPLGMPEAVALAACEGVRRSDCYPDTEYRELRKALSMTEGMPEEQIICGNGAADLIFSLVLAKKPRKALLAAPTFYEYEQALRSIDCEIIYGSLRENDGFSLGEDFLEAITPGVGIVFLCNPNNPTGVLTDAAFMKRVLHRCEDCESLLVVDECFMDFVEDGADYSMKPQCRQSENLFVLKAFTKLYAMPGLRLGYGFSSDSKLLAAMREVSQPWSISVPAQMAGIAALKEQDYVDKSKKILSLEREFLLRELENLNVRCYDSKANYIFFRADKGLYESCLQKGILIRDCANYRGLKAGYYRIAVRRHEENRKLIEVMREIFL